MKRLLNWVRRSSAGHGSAAQPAGGAAPSAHGLEGSLNQEVEDAVKRGDAAEVERLLQEGQVELDGPHDYDGRTFLYIAASRCRPAVVSALLRAGADVRLATEDGSTPLHVAAEHGFEPVADALLQSGADPQPVDRRGQTPLMLAARNGHEAVVSMLLRLGADPDLGGDTSNPLSLAALFGHEPVVSALLRAGAVVDLADSLQTTALWTAAYAGHESVVSTLLRAGAFINVTRANDNSTPLFIAAQYGHDRVVSLLTRAGADPTLAAEFFEDTPLMTAVRYGREPCVEVLLSAGAPRERTGLPALEFAVAEERRPAMVSMLRQAEVAARDATKEAMDDAIGAHVPEFVQEVVELAFSRELWQRLQ